MSEQKTTIYTPESALRRPGRLFREMFIDLLASRELAWRLFVRDISARYRQSVLGYIWVFLPPIATTLTFVLLNRSGILATGETSIPYPVYVMTGTLLWQVFADSISSPIKTVTASKAMLTKINLPKEAILLSGVLEVLFNSAIRLALLFALFGYYRIVPPPASLFVVAGIMAILCLGFAIGVLLTPIGLLYNDVGRALATVLSFWMLFTPVVYTPPSTGTLSVLTKLNPVSPLIVASRDWLAVGATSQFWPAFWVFLLALFLLFAGWILYRVAMPFLIERMGG